ncbi:hypothetical protein SO694_00100034 [Aureococcus anophagefferens]|uniref:Uncharacterized protein n=1 Tax=Aureococcus anophagefferens TaxID=44056 RepID=A0ABR1FMX0_AURAN
MARQWPDKRSGRPPQPWRTKRDEQQFRSALAQERWRSENPATLNDAWATLAATSRKLLAAASRDRSLSAEPAPAERPRAPFGSSAARFASLVPDWSAASSRCSPRSSSLAPSEPLSEANSLPAPAGGPDDASSDLTTETPLPGAAPRAGAAAARRRPLGGRPGETVEVSVKLRVRDTPKKPSPESKRPSPESKRPSPEQWRPAGVGHAAAGAQPGDDDDGVPADVGLHVLFRGLDDGGYVAWRVTVTVRALSLVGLGLGRGDAAEQELGAALRELANLRSLDLARNGLRHAPRRLPRALRTLGLAENRLRSASYLEHLAELEVLDVADNEIASTRAFHHLVLARSSLRQIVIRDLTRLEPAWRQKLRDLFPNAVIS